MDAKNWAQNFILWLWSAYCRGPGFERRKPRIFGAKQVAEIGG